jgi:PEP-CTERM motif
LINRPGATITGAGLISSSFDNQGRLLLTDGTTLITNAFNNSGIIQLAENAASLSGGVITNSGQITGHGSTGNTISNASGTIEASGGTLILGGAVTNGAGGTISATADGKVFASQGLGTSSGLINLTGGTFDNNNHALTNSGQISGYGILRTSGLTNQGNITLATGVSTVNGGVTNQAGGHVEIAHGAAVFTGAVSNQGTFKTTGATVTFAGGFTNLGAYISDPSTQSFTDLVVMPTGFLVGGAGDVFQVSHSFSNQSTQNTSWNTRGAALVFNGAGSESVLLAGLDKGALYDGYADNFAWGTVELGSGAGLSIASGIGAKGALYAGVFALDGGLAQLASIVSDFNIYYDPLLAGNSYLGGQSYALTGAGFLIPTAVPEPETYAMLLAGIGLLGFIARHRKRMLSASNRRQL